VAQITDLEALKAIANQGDHNGSARVRAGVRKTVFDDQYLHEEILALIPRLERYARALTRDVVGADDLVQDCIARALEKIHLWRPGTDLRAWLFTILYRQHISHARRNARARKGIELQKSDANLVFSHAQIVRLEFRDLERGLAKLPEEQRSVILLIGLEGMGYEEAASVVNIPVGTVRSRVARGRESLREVTELFPARHGTRQKSGFPAPGPHAASPSCP
jgi:RNA polymerase sigma-70 factor, ECF subfamily